MVTVAIHQPNFLPWLGYFNKIAIADRFVLLDSVPAWRSGSHYFNRVQIMVSGKPAWITLPLSRQKEDRLSLLDCRIAQHGTWQRKMLKTINLNYAKAAHFAEVMPHVETWLTSDETRLAEFNTAAILDILRLMDLPSDHVVRSSTLDVPGSSTELLINIVRKLGGTEYLSGGGAGGYQDEDAYAEAGLSLSFQSFAHPVYPQFKSDAFQPGLSILDALMHAGFAQTREMIDISGKK
jgi:hypothetical protein